MATNQRQNTAIRSHSGAGPTTHPGTSSEPANGSVFQFPLRYLACHCCELREICVNALERGAQPSLAGILEHPRPLQRGEYLFRQGDPVRYFYIVNSGITKQFITTRDGAEQVVGFTLVGESVSLDYLEDGRHNSNVMVLDTTNVCAIPVARLNREKTLKSLLTDYLLQYTVSEIVRSHKLQQLIGQSAAENKLAFFIFDMARRMKLKGRAGDSITLVMSRHDIANYLCLADETISRLFRKFSEWRVLEVERKRILIRDFELLRSLANNQRSYRLESA